MKKKIRTIEDFKEDLLAILDEVMEEVEEDLESGCLGRREFEELSLQLEVYEAVYTMISDSE